MLPFAASASSASMRRRHAQAGMAPAQDQLLGLGEEFDLADAAAAQLDIVARPPRSRHGRHGRGSGA